ncbi:MAG TPA: hypothetical protein VKR42_01910 [Ktedonobacteraceae bacterium]|nr:hypothetical protein [Ktedonobacteraceae bacterium]
MQQPKHPRSSSDRSDDTLAEDDIDQLFGNLEQVEPPPALIARILANVSQVSQVDAQNKELPADEPGEELDHPGNLVVRHEKKEPS